jgi:CheY-like chemotaxis protein/HPt (histidine-containing phosphotransfer) domain-containing protein
MIFMDMQMPVLDGYTATRRLREAGSTVPIVALTAQALRGDDLRCVEAGCTAYMTKPIDLDRLLETVGRFIPYTTVEAPGDSADAVPPRLVGTNDSLGVAAPDRQVRRIELRKGAKSTLGVQLVKPETTRPARHKIYSQLALSRDEVAEIVRDFQRELKGRLATIQKCLDDRDWESLAREAHWLKGAGGTVGFAEFVEPSLGLEKLARVERDATTASQYVAELRELASAIDSGSNRCL